MELRGRLRGATTAREGFEMPALTTARVPSDPDAVPTHAKGKRFYATLVGIWPLAVALALAATAFGVSTGIALGSALAGALAVDFVLIVMAFAIDDGDIQHASEET
jgi:hypothetical protein